MSGDGKETTAPFTLDELLAFLETEERPEGYLTTREWRAELGASREVIRKIMREADARGVLRVKRARRLGYDGVGRKVPVYTFDLGKQEPGPAEGVTPGAES